MTRCAHVGFDECFYNPESREATISFTRRIFAVLATGQNIAFRIAARIHQPGRTWLTVTMRSEATSAPLRMLTAGPLMEAQLGYSHDSGSYLHTLCISDVLCGVNVMSAAKGAFAFFAAFCRRRSAEPVYNHGALMRRQANGMIKAIKSQTEKDRLRTHQSSGRPKLLKEAAGSTPW